MSEGGEALRRGCCVAVACAANTAQHVVIELFVRRANSCQCCFDYRYAEKEGNYEAFGPCWLRRR